MNLIRGREATDLAEQEISFLVPVPSRACYDPCAPEYVPRRDNWYKAESLVDAWVRRKEDKTARC